jgi:hypothetical protein
VKHLDRLPRSNKRRSGFGASAMNSCMMRASLISYLVNGFPSHLAIWVSSGRRWRWMLLLARDASLPARGWPLGRFGCPFRLALRWDDTIKHSIIVPLLRLTTSLALVLSYLQKRHLRNGPPYARDGQCIINIIKLENGIGNLSRGWM